MGDAKVVTNSDFSRVKTLFVGPLEAARKFVENNFPRAHVEPPGGPDSGTPDVKLVHDAGEETYHADEGWSGTDKPAAEVEDGSALA